MLLYIYNVYVKQKQIKTSTMKNVFKNLSLLALGLFIVFGSCTVHKSTVSVESKSTTSIVPADLIEWDVNLTSSVVPQKQEVQHNFLPEQVYAKFPTGLDFPGWQLVHATAKKNELPGNALSWGITGDFIYWPLTRKKDNWLETRETDPMDFVYIIKSAKDGHMALWFTSPNTVHIKKIQLANKDDRPKEISLPAFEKPVRFSWSFSWIRSAGEEDILNSVKGKVIESSMQNGFVSVITEWSGGESYTLPAAQTLISVNNETVYAD